MWKPCASPPSHCCHPGCSSLEERRQPTGLAAFMDSLSAARGREGSLHVKQAGTLLKPASPWLPCAQIKSRAAGCFGIKDEKQSKTKPIREGGVSWTRPQGERARET